MGVPASRYPDDPALSTSRAVAAEDVAWRQLGKHLWAGRCGDTPVGVIEEGRHFTLTDADESPHPGFRTLEAAQAATGSIPVLPPSARHPGPEERKTIRRVFTARSAAALAAAFSIGGLTIGLLRFGAALFLIQ